MKFWQHVGLFIFVTFLLTAGWQLRPFWIPFFSLSHQDPIDPQNLIVDFDPTVTTAVFDNQSFTIPSIPLAQIKPEEISETTVLGDSDAPKRLEIDLTKQRLYAYEGDQLVYNFLISSGKWGRTPTGRFRIWTKLRYTKMSGGSHALGTYYYLPNVPYVMYFSNAQVPAASGYSLHGTYWHNNFGHPMSHGCVNMKTEEVEKIYYWARPDLRGQTSIRATTDNPGTEITIYGNPVWE